MVNEQQLYIAQLYFYLTLDSSVRDLILNKAQTKL